MNPFQFGALGMAGAMLTPGQGLGAGFNAFQQGLAQARNNDRLDRRDAREEALTQFELTRQRSALDADQRKQRLLSDIQSAISPAQNSRQPVSPESTVATDLRSIMMPPNQAESLGSGTYGIDAFGSDQAPRFDVLNEMSQRTVVPKQTASAPTQGPGGFEMSPDLAMKFLLAGFSPDQMKAIAGARDLGKPKVARTVEFRGSDGMPMVVQLDEQGRQVGDPYRKPDDFQDVDLGGTRGVFNKSTGSFGAGPAKSATFGERESMRHNRVSEGISQQNANSASLQAQNGAWSPVVGADGVTRLVQTRGPNIGSAMPVTGPDGRPVEQGKVAEERNTRVRQAQEALDVASEVERLLPRATGSVIGAAFDRGAAYFGGSNEGSRTTSQLQILASRLVQQVPRFEGPQSDKDIQSYREAAGNLADPSIPISNRQAALEVIKSLNRKYLQQQGAQVDHGRPAAPAGGARRSLDNFYR